MDADGVGIAADSLDLNGGTITLSADSSANATLTHTAVADAATRKVDGSNDMPRAGATRFTMMLMAA